MTTGTIFIATIIAALPELGVAIITTADGSTDIKHLLIAHLPLNDANTGVVTQSNYVDGTAVICLQDSTVPTKAYIIAPANFAIGDKSDTLYGRALYNTEDYTEADSKAFIGALEQLLDTSLSIDFQNYAHGIDINALPGDNDQIDMQGNSGLHIGRFISQLRGSPIAFIDISNVLHAIRMVANKIEQHLPLSYALKDKYLEVHNLAINDSEAFGLSDGLAVKIVDGVPTFEDDNAIPLYRLQTVEGAAADGKEELVVSFPVDEKVHYSTTEPPILAKKRIALDGALYDATANSITSIKSPAIRGIHQVNYDVEGDAAEQTDILKAYKYTEQQTASFPPAPDLESEISDAALNKLIDKLFTGDYLDRLTRKMATLGLKVSSETATLAAYIDKNGEQPKDTFKPGPTDNQQFGLPRFITLTDPTTGKVSTYFNTTSFISQESDGSILICDGYGSEIRMSRGNIYISPALDLFFRPGRDLSAMVPRHQSYNAQATTTINASGSLYIRSVGDLKIAGATGGDGIVSLECDASEVSNSSGLLLRSTAGATLTGHDVYIGINSGIGTTDSRVDNPQTPGTIIIDACSRGKISMRSMEQIVDSESICMLAKDSALAIEPTAIYLFTRTVSTSATLEIVSEKTPTKITVLRDGEQVEITTINSSNPSLVVEGSLLVGANFVCNMSGKFCRSLIANGIGSTSPYCGVVSYQYGDPFAQTEIVKHTPIPSLGINTAASVEALADAIYQDSYVSTNSFTFPADYDVPPTIQVPGMVWQAQTDTNGGIWKEISMTSPDGTVTMCYPGILVWNAATISKPGYDSTSLNTGYITNTITETKKWLKTPKIQKKNS